MAKPKVLIVDAAASSEQLLSSLLDRYEPVPVKSIWRGLKLLTSEPFAGVFVGEDHIHGALQAARLLQNEMILDGLPDGLMLLDFEQTVLWANATARNWLTPKPNSTDPSSDKGAARLCDLLPTLLPYETDRRAFEQAVNQARTQSCQVALTVATPLQTGGRVQDRHLQLTITPVRDAPFHQTLGHTPPADGPSEHLDQQQPVVTPASDRLQPGSLHLDKTSGDQPGPPQSAEYFIVAARDITVEVEQKQKLVAIHTAGAELADLTAAEVAEMSVEERIALLKENILRFAQDLLHFDVIEVRLLDRESGRLEALLSVGMQPLASERQLYADQLNNGVTGYVAATGRSHLCDDTSREPLYLEGCKGGRSSITVALLWQDEVIGTFNVESPQPQAFSKDDLLLLEIFARDVAQALHTLELLVAERAVSTAKSVEAIHGAVALPIDTILNDAVTVLESTVGQPPELVERLRRIVSNARDIKQVIQEVGRRMAPTEALPVSADGHDRPALQGKQILVVDADVEVRTQAHQMLERYGCVVETAHDGGEAVRMARSRSYEAILSAIKLPDMTGHTLLLRLRDLLPAVPLALMAEFGYDRHHTILKARQAGVRWFLIKPLKLEQLLHTVEQLGDVPV